MSGFAVCTGPGIYRDVTNPFTQEAVKPQFVNKAVCAVLARAHFNTLTPFQPCSRMRKVCHRQWFAGQRMTPHTLKIWPNQLALAGVVGHAGTNAV